MTAAAPGAQGKTKDKEFEVVINGTASLPRPRHGDLRGPSGGWPTPATTRRPLFTVTYRNAVALARRQRHPRDRRVGQGQEEGDDVRCPAHDSFVTATTWPAWSRTATPSASSTGSSSSTTSRSSTTPLRFSGVPSSAHWTWAATPRAAEHPRDVLRRRRPPRQERPAHRRTLSTKASRSWSAALISTASCGFSQKPERRLHGLLREGHLLRGDGHRPGPGHRPRRDPAAPSSRSRPTRTTAYSSTSTPSPAEPASPNCNNAPRPDEGRHRWPWRHRRLPARPAREDPVAHDPPLRRRLLPHSQRLPRPRRRQH